MSGFRKNRNSSFKSRREEHGVQRIDSRKSREEVRRSDQKRRQEDRGSYRRDDRRRQGDREARRWDERKSSGKRDERCSRDSRDHREKRNRRALQQRKVETYLPEKYRHGQAGQERREERRENRHQYKSENRVEDTHQRSWIEGHSHEASRQSSYSYENRQDYESRWSPDCRMDYCSQDDEDRQGSIECIDLLDEDENIYQEPVYYHENDDYSGSPIESNSNWANEKEFKKENVPEDCEDQEEEDDDFSDSEDEELNQFEHAELWNLVQANRLKMWAKLREQDKMEIEAEAKVLEAEWVMGDDQDE